MYDKIFPWKYLKTLGGMIQFPSRLKCRSNVFSIASGMICHYLTEKKTILRRIIFGIIIIYQIGFVFMCIKSCEDALIEVELYRGLDSVYILTRILSTIFVMECACRKAQTYKVN